MSKIDSAPAFLRDGPLLLSLSPVALLSLSPLSLLSLSPLPLGEG
jgi:hypothetical protein